ncbi:MAG: M14 family zinc carboxypeptidase [Ferruginibacter sp.]
MKSIFLLIFLLLISPVICIAQQCRFEKTKGRETATYFESIDWYRHLDKVSPFVKMIEMGGTDAGYPLHVVLVSSNGQFEPKQWKTENKVIILVNNGIHPGEPDGIDASMMLVRDIVAKNVKLPENVVLAVIPVYNIGGSLNRGSFSRVNQNGPMEYGFRGNSQNLDLNRDFTKCDSREAKSFTKIFHWLDPEILMDNHVSDGADYQHTMTLITTQYDKLGPVLGTWLKQHFEPGLYKSMAAKGWVMTPYVNFETSIPGSGMEMFYDPPRYSSGYAALFQTISFIPETHMLKAYVDRVHATYALMQTMIDQAGINANELLKQRKKAKAIVAQQDSFALNWQLDTTRYSLVAFMGYKQAFKTSEATGLQRMYYDHSRPFTKQVKLFDVFTPTTYIKKPMGYIIPAGWHDVMKLLQLNGVKMQSFLHDTSLTVEAYHIDEYKSAARAYEKHHRNNNVTVSVTRQSIRFLKGDVYIPLNQTANRYIVEMLEPTGDDSFFAWNFFDAILQQKEGYSDYRWEDTAAEILKNDAVLRRKLNDQKKTDSIFARDASAQLEFIYKNSRYYEPAHMRYPVFRLVQ